MHRFFYPSQPLKANQKVILKETKELHHLIDVVRCSINSQIELFDGKGVSAVGTITALSKGEAHILINTIKKEKNSTVYTILACAIPKKSKFEAIIEKATELGADEIIPLQTKRTEVILKGERAAKKLARFQTVSVNAAKQSKRATLPIIHPITSFKDGLNYCIKETSAIIPSLTPNAKPLFQTLARIKAPKKLSILIGPEGDFTKDEYAQAHKKGALPVTLGRTTLKVDTAALSTLSCTQLFFESK